MKVTVSRYGSHEMIVEIDDIPREDKLVSLDINFQDMAVNLYYEGWKPVAYPLMDVESADAATQTYDGELDDPDHPRIPLGAEVLRRDPSRPRAVKDNPQA